ncbi:ABC transporter ATP-binding protein [Paenibacillus sp. FSL R7-0331]|uniref:ABC transporter ATP-binding protein n=1 Tax=Paenibacillus sp. FSL R7-0331 TaxID=1536773 RepID=UPI0005AA9C68|nr:ABC transporter ATP-binding protein [Paenibacillus sp. FSL R7-0331]
MSEYNLDNSNSGIGVSAEPAAVECIGLGLTLRKKSVLHDVTFDIPRGSLTGLLGPNGAGKSSLLRIIAGLADPDSGSVKIFGKPAGAERLGELSLLPDRSSLPGWLSVREWLDFAAGIYPDWDPAKAQELQVKLSVSTEAVISSLSRGEEARLQLLTCLSRKAPLIILDEPFTGVDLISRERIASAVVGELADGARTFLIATHDIREMELLFDRLILIGGGTIRSIDEVDALRRSGKSVESHYREVFA